MTKTSAATSLWGLDAATYNPHWLHGSGRTYLETNCYADVLIELVHARGDEPVAMFGFVVGTDWEGDQFSYAKPRYDDLLALFGVDIHEMLPYRSLPEHIENQLRIGRTVLVEIDAWWLPDTAATSYRAEHLKTTVAPETIDRDSHYMRYFHNAGLYELKGEDYLGAFHMLPQFTPDVMDPFVEVVRFDAGPRLAGDELRARAHELLLDYFTTRPRHNPFRAWGEHLSDYLPFLLQGDSDAYHAYAFVTVRMVGAAFELLADHVEWVLGSVGTESADVLRRIVDGSKTLSFRMARQRPFDPEPGIETLAEAWEHGMEALGRALS